MSPLCNKCMALIAFGWQDDTSGGCACPQDAPVVALRATRSTLRCRRPIATTARALDAHAECATLLAFGWSDGACAECRGLLVERLAGDIRPRLLAVSA